MLHPPDLRLPKELGKIETSLSENRSTVTKTVQGSPSPPEKFHP